MTDALPPLNPYDHPEPRTMVWSELEMRAIRAYASAAVAAATAHRPALAYMATSREGTVRFTDNPGAARELEGYGWAITPLCDAGPIAEPEPTQEMELAGMRALRNTHRTVSGECSREQARACWDAMQQEQRAETARARKP